jgi:hypothetical protein
VFLVAAWMGARRRENGNSGRGGYRRDDGGDDKAYPSIAAFSAQGGAQEDGRGSRKGGKLPLSAQASFRAPMASARDVDGGLRILSARDAEGTAGSSDEAAAAQRRKERHRRHRKHRHGRSSRKVAPGGVDGDDGTGAGGATMAVRVAGGNGAAEADSDSGREHKRKHRSHRDHSRSRSHRRHHRGKGEEGEESAKYTVADAPPSAPPAFPGLTPVGSAPGRERIYAVPPHPAAAAADAFVGVAEEHDAGRSPSPTLYGAEGRAVNPLAAPPASPDNPWAAVGRASAVDPGSARSTPRGAGAFIMPAAMPAAAGSPSRPADAHALALRTSSSGGVAGPLSSARGLGSSGGGGIGLRSTSSRNVPALQSPKT